MLIETAFLQAGQSLEASIEILGRLTANSESLLAVLEGQNIRDALNALSLGAARVSDSGQVRTGESARFDDMLRLTESIVRRVSQMKVSLKYVDSLAVNARIAAANIDVPGVDFTTFADEIGRTLPVARNTLDSFTAELHVVREQVTAAHAGQDSFERVRHEAAASITERLSATVKSIALQHQRAMRAGHEVQQGSERIRQRICEAILALQIGDITRQRLEHAGSAMDLAGGMRARDAIQPHGAGGIPVLDEDGQRTFAAVVGRLQSAQLDDAAANFERDVKQVTGSLSSLAAEARALRTVETSAFGSAESGGGSFIKELDGQVGEALALLEDFDTARAGVVRVTENVSEATASLCGHLQRVQSLEADIRIMGLNTTFKCARIGREGLALSLIAQELRTYANGFAKEAGALMKEVENVAAVSGSLTAGGEREQAASMAGSSVAMRDSHVTLRQMDQTLDVALQELERDSERVVTLLETAVAELEGRSEFGRVLRDTAGGLTARLPEGQRDLADLAPLVARMVEVMAGGYTMANERAVHDRVLGRAPPPAIVTPAATALEDFLF